jgi:hypothetical protein
MQLRRAAVSAEWEVVGEAEDPDDAVTKVAALRARFLVLDAGASGPEPQEIAAALASLRPKVFLVGVGNVPGADAQIADDSLEDLRDVLAGLLHDAGDHTH